MLTAVERRQAILEYLCQTRYSTRANLVFEFKVSKNTIDRDLQILACSYPVYTVQGNGGGVYVLNGFYISRQYLTTKQTILLEKIAEELNGGDLEVMNSILKAFKEPQKKGGK